MKVLIISPFFYPEKISTGKYNAQLAVALKEAGCDVSVFCSHPLYPKWVPEKTTDELDGIATNRGGAWMRYPRAAMVRRLMLEVWFLFFVSASLIFRRKKYDLIISVFPPNLASILVNLIKGRKTKHVGIVHDIQSVMASSHRSKLRKIVNKAVCLLEQTSYRSCGKLVFLSESMKSKAEHLYSIDNVEKIVCYPFVTVKKNAKVKNSLDEIIKYGENNIVYAGALGEKQSPKELMALFLKIKSVEESVNLYIFSQGSIFNELKLNYSGKGVRFFDLVPEDDLTELLEKSTVQIIPQDPGSVDGAFPSKLPNILALGGKVLCITSPDSELRGILKSYSKALVVTSWEDEDIVSQLLDFIDDDNDPRNDAGDSLLKEKFDIKFITNVLLSRA